MRAAARGSTPTRSPARGRSAGARRCNRSQYPPSPPSPILDPPPSEGIHAPPPVAVKGKPMLWIPRETGELFVVGLVEGHGCERSDWIMLDVARKGSNRPVPVGGDAPGQFLPNGSEPLRGQVHHPPHDPSRRRSAAPPGGRRARTPPTELLSFPRVALEGLRSPGALSSCGKQPAASTREAKEKSISPLTWGGGEV